MEIFGIILAAGAPHGGVKPSPSQAIGVNETVLNWQLRVLKSQRTSLVTGYEPQELVKEYSRVQIVHNEHWESSGSAFSLSLTPEFQSPDYLKLGESLLVCYGDTLFRRQSVKQLHESDADIAIAWDSSQIKEKSSKGGKRPERVYVRDGKLQRAGELPEYLANGTFVGLACFKGEGLRRLSNLMVNHQERFKKATLSDVVDVLRSSGIEVEAIDIHGDWAEVGSDFDIVRFVLGTKAETLARMRQIVTKSQIEEQVSFDVGQWNREQSALISIIQNKFKNNSLIVRSSARSEDSFTHSNAGAYTSILNVDPNNDLKEAIEEVIASYHNQQPDDQVLVQPMLKNVIRSGVAFTLFGVNYHGRFASIMMAG